MERRTLRLTLGALRRGLPTPSASPAEKLHRPAPPPRLRRLLDSTTLTERISLVILTVLLLTSGVWSTRNYIRQHTALVPEAGGIYREGAVGQPRYINPILAGANDLDVDLTGLIYSGLFRYDHDLKLQPDLAREVVTSADHQQYTVTLRNDATWHDGERFTADDVVFTIRSIQTPDYNSPLASAFQNVKVEKVDEHTVKFTLPEPYAPFLSSLTVGLVPEHVWSGIAPQNATLAEQILKPIGTGPFKFADITTRRKTGDITNFRLLRNEAYYDHRPYLDEINFTFYSTNEEAVQAYLAGSVDGLGFLPLQLTNNVNSRRTDLHRLLLPQYFAVFFNQQKSNILKDNGVRAALAMALDRQAIVQEALDGHGEPLHKPIPPGVLDINGAGDTPAPSRDAAQQNLAEAGWQTGDDGIRTKDGRRLSFKLTTTDWPEYVRTAQALQAQWRQLGVEVTLEHLGAGTIQQTAIQPREYEALLFGEVLPPDPDPYSFWHSTQTRSPGLNLALFKNKDVDRLLEEARKEADQAVRTEKYREFQNKIIEHNPAIILYRPHYLFVSRGVYGINPHYAALPAGRFNNAAYWHTNIKRVWR